MPGEDHPQRPREFLTSPLAVVAACFALGIVLARAQHCRGARIGLFLAAAGVCLLVGLIALRADWRRVASLMALAGFALAGAAAARLFEVRFPPNHVSHLESLGVDLADPVRLEGQVASTPLRTSYGVQFDVLVKRVESGGRIHAVTGKVRLRLQASEDPEIAVNWDSLRLQYGDSIRTLTRLRRARIYQNPGSFNFRDWMESIEDLYWVGTVKSPLLIEKLPGEGPPRLYALIEKTRQRLLHGIDQLYPPWSVRGRHGAVLKAVLLGDRSALDSDTIENFRTTGLYHLLVVSGLNVGLLALLAGILLHALGVRPTVSTVVELLFLLAYASLVEHSAPTLRATLMICAYLVARFLYRASAAMNAIGLAALILLLHRPAWLFESGFQLSFAATLLIAGLAGPLIERTTLAYRRALRRLDEVEHDDAFAPRQAQFRLDLRALIATVSARLPLLKHHPAFAAAAAVTGPVTGILWAAEILLFSAILQLGLLLPMTETFHRVTFAGIGLNALAIPLMTLILGFALPTVILSAIWPALAAWPAKAVAFLMNGLLALTELPGLPRWLSYRVPEPPAWVAWGFVLSLVIAAWSLGRRARMFWVALGALGAFATLISLHPFAPRLPRGVLEVTALDCGGGDSLFLVLPDQTTLLVDAGGTRSRSTREGAFQGRRWDPGEDIVSPYLWSRGIDEIDIVVLTHAHEDHLGGLGAVLRNFRVGEFWHGANPLTPAYQVLLEQVRRRGVPIREVGAGDLITQGAASVEILWPPPGPTASRTPSNDDSVVMRIAHGEARILLPGDISGGVEQELLRSAKPLESQVLKVAHHGARSSSGADFLARVSPQVAIVTVESGNPTKRPAPETLDRLRVSGARIFRTDLVGAVTVVMNRGPLSVRTYRRSPAGSSAGPDGGAGIGRADSSVP